MSALLPPHAATSLQALAVAPYQLFATGLQKSGSSIMTAALGKGLGVPFETEAVTSCCCAGGTGVVWNDDYPSGFARQECVNDADIAGPLFGDNPSRYLSTCASQLNATVVKADDMVWQIDSIMQHFFSLPASSPAAGMQFLFYVRHPLFNIRSLLAWCAPTIDECGPSMQAEAAEGSNNTLYRRIFVDRHTRDPATRPVELATVWKEAANVYLRKPSRFAAVLRFEDFLRDPVVQVERVHSTAHAAWRRSGTAVGADALAPAVDGDAVRSLVAEDQETPAGDFDHDVAADELFDTSTTSAILAMCAEEMARFGYTRTGADYSWSAVRPALSARK